MLRFGFGLTYTQFRYGPTRLSAAVLKDGVLAATAGRLHPDPGRPGHGMVLRGDDAERFRVA